MATIVARAPLDFDSFEPFDYFYDIKGLEVDPNSFTLDLVINARIGIHPNNTIVGEFMRKNQQVVRMVATATEFMWMRRGGESISSTIFHRLMAISSEVFGEGLDGVAGYAIIKNTSGLWNPICNAINDEKTDEQITVLVKKVRASFGGNPTWQKYILVAATLDRAGIDISFDSLDLITVVAEIWDTHGFTAMRDVYSLLRAGHSMNMTKLAIDNGIDDETLGSAAGGLRDGS